MFSFTLPLNVSCVTSGAPSHVSCKVDRTILLLTILRLLQLTGIRTTPASESAILVCVRFVNNSEAGQYFSKMRTLLAPATLLAALLLASSAAAQVWEDGESPQPAPEDGTTFGGFAPTRQPPSAGGSSPAGGSSSSSKAGLIAGLIVAVCVLLAVALVGVVYFYRVRKAPPAAAAGMASNGHDKVPVPGDGGSDKRPGPPQDASSLDKRAASNV